jgi:hypothetical protein
MHDETSALEFRVMSPGRTAYEGLGKSRGWKNAIGAPMPPWTEMRRDLQLGWEEAAIEVLSMPRPVVVLLQQIVDCLEDLLKRKRGNEETGELVSALAHFRLGSAELGLYSARLKRLRDEAPQG